MSKKCDFNFDNYFKNYPNDQGYFGKYGGVYVSEELKQAMQEITEEKMPIILDETFAYYDNDRLENILKYLNENYKENQIIIFTCSNREKEIFEKCNIKYNHINLHN